MLWLLIIGATAVAVVAAGKSSPLRVPTGPLTKKPAPKSGNDSWALVADFRPTPGKHGSINSKWCLPAVAGGGCRELPITLGYPEAWIPADDFAITLRDFAEPTDVWVEVRAYASTKNPEATSGKPQYFTDKPCWTWTFMGKVGKGPVPLVDTAQGDAFGPGGECSLAYPAPLQPRIVMVPEDEILHMVFSAPAGDSVVRFAIDAQWHD